MTEGRRPRVLIVEDEWLIAAFLEDILQGMGCEVLGPVPSVEQALAIIANDPPDAAVLDISLGRENSLPVADVLLRDEIPFVFASGYMTADLPAPYSNCIVLAKPISESQLQPVLRDLIDRGRGAKDRT
ncbi:MAG TPA: response regulator [Rhizomicrobium sp.]|jgi:CheY-like chemotaxis protein|nr:response regulator [Rhizomicrobium sp.]